MPEESSLELARSSATIEIPSAVIAQGNLSATVRVTNKAGHKLPSGVGFRRAFLALLVLDAAGSVLWASGRTSPEGVILGAGRKPLATEFSPTEIQPHHEVISNEDQVQIYEERFLDTSGKLTTSFLGLHRVIKDNRLLPLGWAKDHPDSHLTHPEFVNGDPRYDDKSGSDEVIYKVPISALPKPPKSVVATLYYQAIPPYYLRDRFTVGKGKPETHRLHYFASHLNTTEAGSPICDWRLELTTAKRTLP